FTGVDTVSCVGASFCAAGGTYSPDGSVLLPFVVDETSGVWGNAITVPGIAALHPEAYTRDSTDMTRTTSVSCPSAGNCAAGGIYVQRVGGEDVAHPFVVDERSGVWGNAIVVKNTLGHPLAGTVSVVVSCRSAGNCVTGGSFTSPGWGAFLVEE